MEWKEMMIVVVVSRGLSILVFYAVLLLMMSLFYPLCWWWWGSAACYNIFFFTFLSDCNSQLLQRRARMEVVVLFLLLFVFPLPYHNKTESRELCVGTWKVERKGMRRRRRATTGRNPIIGFSLSFLFFHRKSVESRLFLKPLTHTYMQSGIFCVTWVL